MKAAIYYGKEHIEVKEIDYPTLGDNDVIIKNIRSSICGTDVAVFNHGTGTGHRIEVGGEFGHETVSLIAEVGKNVTEFESGQRVYPYPRYAKGDTRKAGIIGGFSEYILVPNAKLNHSLYFVPEQISDKTASLIEPFTVGCRAARRSQPKNEESAVVFGCGTIGLAAAIALKWFGCNNVMICDLSDYRLNIAKNLGFEVCNTSTDNFFDKFVNFFGEAQGLDGVAPNADIYIDAAGHESVLDLYMKHGKIESRFVSVAVNNAIRNLDLLRLTYSQKSIIGSGGYMPEDVRDVLEIMGSGRWNIEQMITHEYPLSELESAIRKASVANEALNVTIYFDGMQTH